MNKTELRTTLIKTGLVLGAIFFVLILALSAPQNSGVWGTLGAIFAGFFETAKLLGGLALTFAVLFFFCFILFKGYKAIFLNKDHLDNKMTGKLRSLEKMELFQKITGAKEREDRRNTARRFVTLEENQKKLADQISSMESQIHHCELKADKAAPAEVLGRIRNNMSSLTEKVANLQKSLETVPGEVLGKMEDDMSSLTAKIEELRKSDKADSGEILGKMKDDMSSLTTKVESFRKTMEIVQNEINVMRAKMEDIETAETLPEKSDEEHLKKAEHRIFTFIEDDNNRDAFIKKVKEAVDQGLSYARSIDYIVENSSKNLAEVIVSHPSLTRDYIKICRQP